MQDAGPPFSQLSPHSVLHGAASHDEGVGHRVFHNSPDVVNVVEKSGGAFVVESGINVCHLNRNYEILKKKLV